MAFPSLVLGAFNLTAWSGSAYQTQVIAEGTSKGSPVPIEVAVKSWLQDGSIVATQGYDNRTVTLRVKLRALTLTAVSQAEAALNAELGKPNTLTWTPASGPASVFVVVTSSMDLAPSTDEDIAEGLAAYPWRTYNIRLLCEAFTRSTTETVAAAIGSGTQTVIPTPSSVTVDSGSSATGWTANYGRTDAFGGGIDSGSITPTVSSGAIFANTPTSSGSPAVFTTQIEALRTGSVDVSVTKQVVVSWKWDVQGTYDITTVRVQSVQLLVNEATTPVYLDLVGGATSPTQNTFADTIFRASASLSTILTMRLVVRITAEFTPAHFGATSEAIYIDQIVRNNADSSVSTPRQLQRTIAVAGSARTQGSVTIAHETSALGDVLAYFWPDVGVNYSPAMRQFRTSGSGVTADTTLVSGARENLVGATTVFTVSANRVVSGMHLLMARLGGAATTATVNWAITTVINGVDTGPTVTGTRVVPITVAYQILPIDRVMLPTREVNALSSTAQVKITLTCSVSSGSTANLDEAWFFNSTIGQLIQTACGTAAPSSGGSSNRLFIKPATATNPRPILRIGFASDESDSAFALSTSSWEFPQFVPSVNNVFTVTTNALDAAVTLRHFPRWHTNAGS